MNISATILAAGSSQRMHGNNKLLLPFKDKTLINAVCQTIIDSNLEPIFVVTGFENNKVAKALPKSIDKIIYNKDWQKGIAQSINKAIISLPKNIDLNNIIIAYEPVWSIGTGLIPKIEEISDTHHFIKNEILKNNNTKVLYGGSVKANNYKKILDAANVDGLLVGGASLNLDEFNQILNF